MFYGSYFEISAAFPNVNKTHDDLPRGMWTYSHVEFSADDGVVQEADRHAVYPRYERFEADLIVAGGAELNHGGDLVVVDIFDDHCSRKLLTL